MRNARALTLLVFAGFASACATTTTPAAPPPAAEPTPVDFTWTRAGFDHPTYRWRLPYLAGTPDLLGADWRLVGWAWNANGAFVHNDFDNDLHFVDVRDNGQVWIQTYPLGPQDATKDLDVLFDNFATTVTSLYIPNRPVILERKSIALGTKAALSVGIEREPTKEELENHLHVRAAKLRLVVTKFAYQKNTDREPRWATAFMVIGYVNDDTRFENGLGDFAKLLGRLVLPPTPPGAPAFAPLPVKPEEVKSKALKSVDPNDRVDI
ncbi:MAG TPA: hypothetical protein VHJ20_12670 [Polyangia bacterium]|nr:hypothetical protein [Polyangia bacterium]